MTTSPSLPVHDPLTPFADLKGLAVHDAEDLLTGYLFGVLTETETGLVRFLDIELADKGQHVLIPVGHARLEESVSGRRIRLRAATLDDLKEVPAATADTAIPSHDEARRLAEMSGKLFRGDRYYAHPAYDHGGRYAGEHPIVCEDDAGPRDVEGLELLNTSNTFRLAKDERDVRGWSVVGADGKSAGNVADLLFDAAAMKVRYIVVLRPEGDETLLPIGYVDFAENKVMVPGLDACDIGELSRFEGLPLTRMYEEGLLGHIERALDARNPFLRVDFSHRQMIS